MGVATGAHKLLDVTAVTTTQTSLDWELPNAAAGAYFVAKFTITPGVTGATILIFGKDEVSGAYYEINATPTAINATGTFVYLIYPSGGAAPGAGSGITQLTNNAFLPPKGRVALTVTDGTFTGTVSMTPIIE